MRKFVNVRLPVLIALSLCCGIALGIVLYFYNLSAGWIALSVIPAAIIFTIWYFKKKKIVKPSVFVLLPLILFIGGALNSFYSLQRFAHTEVESAHNYEVCGTVIEKGITENGEYIIINNITIDGNEIDGKAYVYLSSTYGELCDVGYGVEFYSSLQKVEPFQYGELNSYADENIKYRASVFSGLQSTYGYSFLGSIRANIGNALFNNLHEESAAISYAMLTGNTKLAESESIQSFRYGGVAHIFAVSGLHIGIVFAIVSYILNKLKINKYISAIICITCLLFYTAVCGFSLSAMRATIMCAVSTISKLAVERYDGLNSVAVAVIIILSFSPLSLLSVGFQLSVGAVCGIFSLSKYIAKGLRRIKIPNLIRLAIGISIGAQLGTMPILLANFGYISGAGLLLNLLVLPILSAMFVVMFIATLISTIIPGIASFIIPYAAKPLELTISIFTSAGFEKALISGFGAGAFAPLYFIGILAINDKINLKFVPRMVALGCTIIALTSYVLIRTYSPFSGYNIIISAYGSGGEVIIKSTQGTVLIVTDEVGSARLESMLNRNYCSKIDTLIILGYDDLSAYANLGIDCDNIYICDRFPQVQPYGDLLINYVSNFSVYGVEYTLYDQNTLLADVDGIKIGICAVTNTQILSCDILVSDTQNQLADCEFEVYFNNRLGTLNIFDCGDIIFKIKDGNYRLINAIPPKR